MPAFDVIVDGLTHRIRGDHIPTEAEADDIRESLRGRDAYTQHEQANGLPPGMLRALANAESGFNPKATSPTGVHGLMQFTKATGKRYGLTAQNFADPKAQIAAAGRFMKDNLAATGGDVRAALARYGDPKEAGYADKVLAKWPNAPVSRETPGAPAEGGPELRNPPNAPPAAPPAPTVGLARIGADPAVQAAGRRLGQVATDFVGALHRYGIPASAQDVRTWLVQHGVPGAESIDAVTPEGGLATAMALAGPAYLATGLPLIGTATEAVTGSRRAGDLAELAVGGVQSIRQVGGLVKAGKQVVADVRAARAGVLTEDQVGRILRTFDVARDEAARAEMAHGVVASMRRKATMEALTVRPSTLRSGAEEFQRVSGLADKEAASPAEVGALLKATGRERYTIPGEQVGRRSVEAATGARTKALFDKARKFAVAGEVPFDRESAEALGIMDRTADLVDRVTGFRAGGKTGEAASGLTRDALRGASLNRDEEDVLFQLRHIGDPTGPQSMAELQDLYGSARRVAMKPGAFPGPSDAKNELASITEDLGRMIRTQLAPHERAAAAWDDATGYVLRARRPAVDVARRLGGAPTETKAFDALIGDPTNLFHTLRHAGPEQAMKIRQAAFTTGLRQSHGDLSQLGTWWQGLDTETRRMLAASASPRSAKALATILAKGGPERQARQAWTKALRGAGDDLDVGVDAVSEAIRRVQANVNRIRPMGSVFGRYHLARAAMSAFSPAGSMMVPYHLGSYVLLTRPGLVSAIFSVPPESARWTQAVGALDGFLKPIVAAQLAQQKSAGAAPIQLPLRPAGAP